MCGIAGILNVTPAVSGPIPEQALDAMVSALAHRGPDGEGRHSVLGVALGMRRLSIIDVEGGDQPIWNEAESMCVVFNGEIYNYVELLQELRSGGHSMRTRSDTEAIIHAYEDDQVSFATRLRGMFAIAIYDRERRQLTLARGFGYRQAGYGARVGERLVVRADEGR